MERSIVAVFAQVLVARKQLVDAKEKCPAATKVVDTDMKDILESDTGLVAETFWNILSVDDHVQTRIISLLYRINRVSMLNSSSKYILGYS